MERDPRRALPLNAPRRACVHGDRAKDDTTIGGLLAALLALAMISLLDVRGAVGVVGNRGVVTRSRGLYLRPARSMADRDECGRSWITPTTSGCPKRGGTMVRFDVSRVNPRYRRFVHAFGIGAACFVVLMAVWIGYGTFEMFQKGIPAEITLLGLALICFIIAGFGWIASMMLAPFATWVEVDDQGVRFGAVSSPIWQHNWDEPSFRLALDQTDGVWDSISKGEPAWTAAIGRTSYRALLTREAFDSITGVATRHGLTQTRGPSSRRGWTRIVVARPNE